MRRVLKEKFFSRTADIVAPDLLGKFLCTKKQCFLITEVEAYDGFDDLASHAARGRTTRTEVMYGPPGCWYVYLIYGMYEMLNIVTGAKGYPSAVLIRAVEGLDGPGKLTRDLKITRAYNAKFASKKNRLWIEDRGVVISKKDISLTPRIGVAYAKEWAGVPWRFVLKK